MTHSQKTLAAIVGSVVIVVGGIIALTRYQAPTVAGQYDTLASCLTSKGVKFYGASWCPHCAEQKRILGASMSKINYVECALPGNQQGQTQVCKDAKIDTYPTWEFADGTRVSGVQQPQALADKSGCTVDSATGTK